MVLPLPLVPPPLQTACLHRSRKLHIKPMYSTAVQKDRFLNTTRSLASVTKSAPAPPPCLHGLCYCHGPFLVDCCILMKSRLEGAFRGLGEDKEGPQREEPRYERSHITPLLFTLCSPTTAGTNAHQRMACCAGRSVCTLINFLVDCLASRARPCLYIHMCNRPFLVFVFRQRG